MRPPRYELTARLLVTRPSAGNVDVEDTLAYDLPAIVGGKPFAQDVARTVLAAVVDDDDFLGDLHGAHAALQRTLNTAICLDESIHDVRTADEAIALGACRIINIKPGRVGGHTESIRVHDVAAASGVPVWHGGMLESGIGRAHNIHLSTLPNFRLPGDIAASRRYYAPDLIDPPIEVRADGTIAVPTGPGIGVDVVWERVKAATQATRDLS